MPSQIERLDFLYVSLVGQVVVVYTVDGEATEGLFTAPSEDGSVIQLLQTRNRCSGASGPTSASTTHELLHIPMDSVVWIDAPSVRLEAAAVGKVERFQGKPMDWAEMAVEDDQDDTFEEEARNHKPGSFDQFAVNKAKFGVVSTYDENAYTTKLDKSKISKEQQEAADRLAKEIEGSAARGGIQHRIERGEEIDMDEGELHSDVQRVQPPVERGGNKTKPTPASAPTSSATAGRGNTTNTAKDLSGASPTAGLNANAPAWGGAAPAVVLNAFVEIAKHIDKIPLAAEMNLSWGKALDPYREDQLQQHQPNFPVQHHHHHHHHHALNFMPGAMQHHNSLHAFHGNQYSDHSHHHHHNHHHHHHHSGGYASVGSTPQPPQHSVPSSISAPPQAAPPSSNDAPARALTRGGGGAVAARPASGNQPQQPVSSVSAKATPPTRGGRPAVLVRHEDPSAAPTTMQPTAPSRGGSKRDPK